MNLARLTFDETNTKNQDGVAEPTIIMVYIYACATDIGHALCSVQLMIPCVQFFDHQAPVSRRLGIISRSDQPCNNQCTCLPGNLLPTQALSLPPSPRLS